MSPSKPPPNPTKRPPRITNPAALRQAALRQIPHRALMRGVMALPPVPGLLDFYTERLARLFGVLGRSTAPNQAQQLRQMLERNIAQSYRDSPYSRVVVAYHTDQQGMMINYKVTLESHSLRDQYKVMFERAGAALFPAEPDTFVLEFIDGLESPEPLKVLDIGAGLGRNAFPLVRRGHSVDAVELTPLFADELRKASETSGLPLGVFDGDAISRLVPLAHNHYDVVLLCDVVTSHVRNASHLGRLFERTAEMLKPGGVLLFNAFVADTGCRPDDLTRQVAEVFWSVLFLEEEVRAAEGCAPFDKILDQLASREGSLSHLFDWLSVSFAEWTELRHVFAMPPGSKAGELRWLAFKRKATNP